MTTSTSVERRRRVARRALLSLSTILCSALAVPTIAHADAGPGYVTNILTVSDDHSYVFDQSGSRSNIPSCGAGLPVRWAIDPTTPFGQAVLATLLSAFALNKQVAIVGSGNCAVHGDTETVRYLDIPS